ncbi:MAG: nitroreductase [Clostridia bacterium]|nr:nitroreductase [Clostridia bacterium]
MNEVIRNLKTRRSVRAFSDRVIEKEYLLEIADCARYAPSGRNGQPWNFCVVQNPEIIGELAASVGKNLGREGYDFYGPNALIIVSCDRESRFELQDGSGALQNIFLAASSLGIGSVWINQLRDTCDCEDCRALLTRLGIPEGYRVVGTAALGYPADENAFRVAEKKNDVTEFWL